jgi:16S rRNA (cytidine1402-2'-O)-methyltransferase
MENLLSMNASPNDQTGEPAEPDLQTPFQASSDPLPGGLYVVSTPIGNLGDITLRALDILRRASKIYAEDTRHTRKLLSLLGIPAGELRSYHDHNADQVRDGILAALAADESIALVSDAGTPLISDPGFKLVRAAWEAGAQVFAAPGASAVLSALAVAGLPTDRFLFAGFLAAKSTARRSELAELARVPATLVFYESPQRAAESLADMADILGDRPACLARELTKLHEETWRGGLVELARRAAERDLRGEIVIVVGAPLPDAPPAEEAIDAALSEALAAGASVKDAAAEIAGRFGLPKREIYARALFLSRNG